MQILMRIFYTKSELLRWLQGHIGIGLMLCASPVLGETNPQTLESYIREVWQHSQQIRAKIDQSDLAGGDRYRRFLPNEPQATFQSQDNGGWQQAGLSLSIPFPGRSLLLSPIDAARERAAQWDLKATKWEMTKGALDLFLDCASSQKSLELQKRSVYDFKTITTSLERLYEKGHSTQAESLSAKLTLRQQESELSLLEGRTAESCRRVSAMIPAREIDKEFVLPDDLSPELLKEIGEENAETLRPKMQLETAQAAKAATVWKQLPDLTFSALQNRYFNPTSSPVGKPLTYSYQVSFTLPLLFFFNELPNVQKERADASAQTEQAEIALRVAKSAKAQAAGDFVRMRKRIEGLDKEDIPMAEAMLESTMSAYRTGKLGFAEVILSRRLFQDLKSQRLQLQVSKLQTRLRCLQECEKGNL